jgi:hypothetical protein
VGGFSGLVSDYGCGMFYRARTPCGYQSVLDASTYRLGRLLFGTAWTPNDHVEHLLSRQQCVAE